MRTIAGLLGYSWAGWASEERAAGWPFTIALKRTLFAAAPATGGCIPAVASTHRNAAAIQRDGRDQRRRVLPGTHRFPMASSAAGLDGRRPAAEGRTPCHQDQSIGLSARPGPVPDLPTGQPSQEPGNGPHGGRNHEGHQPRSVNPQHPTPQSGHQPSDYSNDDQADHGAEAVVPSTTTSKAAQERFCVGPDNQEQQQPDHSPDRRQGEWEGSTAQPSI